jgi:membrane protease YdiL (CAAX protease family)
VEVTTEVTARALPARYLPLTFGAVFATALTFTALRLLGIPYDRVAGALGLRDLPLFRVAVYSVWAAVTALVLTWLLRRQGLTAADLGWRRPERSRTLPAVVVATLAAIALWPPVEALNRTLGIPTYWSPGQTGFVRPMSAWEFVVAGLAGLVLVPPAEETLFRGYALPVLRAKLGPAAGLVAHNALFALYHSAVGPGLTVYIFFWSFAPALLFLRLRSVLPGLAMHVLNNAFVDLLLPALLAPSGR